MVSCSLLRNTFSVNSSMYIFEHLNLIITKDSVANILFRTVVLGSDIIFIYHQFEGGRARVAYFKKLSYDLA